MQLKKLPNYWNYQIPERFTNKFQPTIKENVVGSICELAKLLEPKGYLLELVSASGDYLTKAKFSIPVHIEKQMCIAVSNKGASDKWIVSSIRIEKSEGADELFINKSIEQLFLIKKQTDKKSSIEFPLDFRGAVYLKWKEKMNEAGYNLEIIESHNNQDVFKAVKNASVAKFRVWYKNDGFFTQFIMLEKTEENLGENIKKWLLNGN